MKRPTIHVWANGDDWHYSILFPNPAGGGGSYGHYFNLRFKTAAEAKRHAREHIGRPGYGGDSGTVENWRKARVIVHAGAWSPAGIYGTGPTKLSGRQRVREALREYVRGSNPRGRFSKKPKGPKVARKRAKAAERESRDYLEWYAAGGDTPAPSQRRKTTKLRNFTGTIRRKRNGTVVIIGTGPKPPGARAL